MLCIEGKVSRLQKLVNMKSLFSNREHELQYLLHCQSAGALCWVIIAHLGKSRSWRCLAAKPEICQGLLHNGSSDIEEMIDQGMLVECESIGEGNWDLSKLFL